MTDDIVARLRARASRCTHGMERYYNGPEGIEKYFNAICGWCFSCSEAADEIERLRQQLAEHRLPGDSGDNTISDQTS